MPDVLVAYYSETGHTAAAATRVARMLGGDVERIFPASGSARSMLAKALAALLGREEGVASPARDPGGYRLVIVATPVWAGRLPPPVRGYLAKVRGRIGAAGFMATSGGAGSARTLRAMREAIGHAPLAEVTISDADRRSGADSAKLAAFADVLRKHRQAA